MSETLPTRADATGATCVWRLETASGVPLSDPGALTTAWRRAPHAVAIELAARAPGRDRQVIGRAVIGTRTDLATLRARAGAVGALLAERARVSGHAMLADPLPVRRAPPPAARFRGALRERLDEIRAALVEEQPMVGIAERRLDAALDTGLGAISWHAATRACAAPAPWDGARLLCEERDAGPSRRVRLLAMSPDGAGRLVRGRVLLEGPHDVAHPSVATIDGRTYVLPSTPAAGSTTLWRLSEGGGLAAIAEIAPGRRLADPTLFRADGLWWIACTDAAGGADDTLCLWHATRPQGPWRPHAGNPVKIDVRSSRPAGAPFRAQGQLWRPAQDCAAARGAAVMLNRVERLTPSEYRERPIRRLGPGRRDAGGLATVAIWNDQTVVGGTRAVFRPGRLLAALATGLLGPEARRLPAAGTAPGLTSPA